MREMLAVKASANKIKGYNQLERGKMMFTKENADHFYVLPPGRRTESSVPQGRVDSSKMELFSGGLGHSSNKQKWTSSHEARCPFFASVLTLALLATFSRLPSSSVSQIRLFFNRTKGRGTAGRILQEILNQVK